MKYSYGLLLFASFVLMNCQPPTGQQERESIRLVTLDPGHFHAALVQKTMLEGVDSTVHVYAPQSTDLQLHLDRIKGFNERPENPTQWNEVVYAGEDFWERFLAERSGNVVVLSGNNQKKTEYIARSIEAGYHVLADKPMVISREDFPLLKQAVQMAREKDLMLYDIMTERYEITTMLQRELSMLPELFGELEKGTPENPAVTKESVHHFYKYVSGSVLTRPAWFMDVEQQGEGIVDVTTHLVDLVQWECFPDQILDTTDVRILAARRWTTPMTRSEFSAITRLDDFPDYLRKDVTGDTLRVFANGEIVYSLRGVHAKVSVTWAYQAPEGAGDTHYSIMRGTKANLVIRQGQEQGYKPRLYLELLDPGSYTEESLHRAAASVLSKHSGLSIRQVSNKEWEVVIPDSYREGHEAHFGRVMEKYVGYLNSRDMPDWEVPNLITKYYTTIRALEVAKSGMEAEF